MLTYIDIDMWFLSFCLQNMLRGNFNVPIYDFNVSDTGTEWNVYIPEIKVNKIILINREVA